MADPVYNPCANCGATAAKLRRKLCTKCYRRLEVRGRFRMVKVVGLGALGNDMDGDAPEPEEPTSAMSGSAEKIEEMRRRYEGRKRLQHRLDNLAFMRERKIDLMVQLRRAARLMGVGT